MLPLSKNLVLMTCCALGLALPGRTLAQEGNQAPQQETKPSTTGSPASPIPEIASSALPDSPGTSWAQAQDASNPQTAAPQTATPSTPQTSTSQATAQDQSAQDQPAQDQSPKPQRPVGTAAAEAPKVNGVTAAQPSGVAIAPAKQRRVRTIVLRVGAIAAAGAALGSVIALTAGTSSKPPGAH